jgi:hypothetical protein
MFDTMSLAPERHSLFHVIQTFVVLLDSTWIGIIGFLQRNNNRL